MSNPAEATGGEAFTEVDVLLRRGRIPRPDMIFLTHQQLEQQSKLEAKRGLADDDYRPVYIAPYLSSGVHQQGPRESRPESPKSANGMPTRRCRTIGS